MITYHTVIQDIPQQHVILLRDILFQNHEPRTSARIPQHTVIVRSGDQQLAACVMQRQKQKEN